MPRPDKFISANDLPERSEFDGQERWVYIGDGHYRKFIGKDGHWVDTLEGMYNQEES